jgi:hypothetical protein
MLLGEAQSITHAKAFKRAKRELAIRSVREGFGEAGEWFWALPQHPSLDVAQSAAGKPEDLSGLEPQPQPGGIGVPRQWADGIASLRRQRAPADVPLHRWRLFIDDCERFLDPETIWAARAPALGWDALSLFGCALAQPLAHIQAAGLIWALRGRKIVQLYGDWASIQDPADRSQHVFNRRVTYGMRITLPWLRR